MHEHEQPRHEPHGTKSDHPAVTEAEILAVEPEPEPVTEHEFADPVDEAIADSFPASDPPAWTLGTD